MYFLSNICENPDFLRVIFFGIKILKVVFLIVPIALIILTTIDIFKMIVTNENKDTVKGNKTIINRFIFAILIFFVPTIVSAVMNLLSTSGINSDYIKCLKNASSLETINNLDINNNDDSDISNGNNNITNNIPNQNTNFENFGSGTESQYFAPVQNVSYNRGSYSNTAGCSNSKVYHDISGISEGTPIYAGIDGEALFYQKYCPSNNQLYTYGNIVKITGNDGTYILYAHLQTFPSNITDSSSEELITKTCPKNENNTPPCPGSSCADGIKEKIIAKAKVKKGDLIGYVGNTGNSTGTHLHIEIHPEGKKSCIENPWKAFGMEN